jgi:cytosine/adenosine deaminase-related metal-dependent hydrolase
LFWRSFAENMASRNILLKNGIALVHDANDRVVPQNIDILVQDGNIARLQKDIEPPANVEVIDCTDKIISPGFIDTHHHAWQTQLKGRHANQLLIEYMVAGTLVTDLYLPLRLTRYRELTTPAIQR